MFEFIFRQFSKVLLGATFVFSCISSSYGQLGINMVGGRMQLQLNRGVFNATYHLILTAHGSDEINDADAPFLGGGFVAVAAVIGEGRLLSIDERLADTAVRRIQLHVSGWSAGSYTLKFKLADQFFQNYHVKLQDAYAQITKTITPLDSIYNFSMDAHTLAMPPVSRFSLVLHPKRTISHTLQDTVPITIYPNPFQGSLYVNTNAPGQPMIIQVSDIFGRQMLSTALAADCEHCEINTAHLPSGIYLIDIFDTKSGGRLKSFKMIKQ